MNELLVLGSCVHSPYNVMRAKGPEECTSAVSELWMGGWS